MAVIIGNSTIVTVSNITEGGLISVDWSFGTNVERLYSLGGGVGACGVNEYATIRDSSVSVSWSAYGGTSSSLSTCPLEGCTNSPAAVIISIVPAACSTGEVEGLNSQVVYLTSYEYSKERNNYGTESYQGTAWVENQTTGENNYVRTVPSVVALGLAEGTIETEGSDIQELVGALFRDDAIIDESFKGSAQAGNLSFSDGVWVQQGTFKQIGASKFGLGDGWEAYLGRASVTLNIQDIYISS